MAQFFEYKIVQGNGVTSQKWLSEYGSQGFKPISSSCCVGAAPQSQVQIVIVMERPIPLKGE
jgi:hypothetical protein